jgi:predicted dehydrogenase
MDPAEGGGRILGEACHFIDLMTFLAGSVPVKITAHDTPSGGGKKEDNFSAVVEFAGGASGCLVYTSAGDRSFGKERFEVFCGGNAAVLDDFRILEIWRDGRRQVWHSRMRQDKGHKAIWDAFLQAVIQGGKAPIPMEELFAVTRATFALQQAVRENRTVTLK